VKGFVTEESLG